jgi:hypothetical protein
VLRIIEGAAFLPRKAVIGVVPTFSDRNWARRFFYNGLHSLSFPWLYNHRPIWDIIVIAFMIGSTALCVRALVLAWRAVGRRLRRAAQRALLAAAVLAVFVGLGAAAATAQTTLAEVKSLRCTFTRQTTGSWAKGDAPETAVRPSSLVLRFEAIDAESGTARLRTGAMATDVTVRLAEGYLHLMQAFRTGPLYITTVFAAGATARGFKAAHSRHELFTTPLPGATSSPEQYYGTCEAGR